MTDLPSPDTIQLLLFTRYPRPGSSKTRLIPALGAEGAAALQRDMTRFTLKEALKTGFPLEVRYTGARPEEMRNWLGEGFSLADQGDGDLGERLDRAFREHFTKKARFVIVLGADCPDNRADTILACAKALGQKDWAIGPAKDGGYYMLGMGRYLPRLFQGVDWGTSKVLAQTLAAEKSTPFLLPCLSDVDEKEDIPKKISVILPTLNEAPFIEKTLTSLGQGFHVEILVSDGGSRDRTPEIARSCGAEVLKSPPGRARQMNCAAARASGSILFFLHGDSLAPENWDRDLRQILKQPGVALGAFHFDLQEKIPGMDLLIRAVRFRSCQMKRPYGDQGLFMHKSLFEELGGFPDEPILEDLLLVKKARKLGRIAMTASSVKTSARRWQQKGLLRTTLIHQAILLGAAMGLSPRRLMKLLRR